MSGRPGPCELDHPKGGLGGVESASMHELSIISSVVESVTESLAEYPGARVLEVRLRVGVLAALVEDALQFCYEIASEDTPLAGSRLVVNMVPVMVHCGACGHDGELENLQ